MLLTRILTALACLAFLATAHASHESARPVCMIGTSPALATIGSGTAYSTTFYVVASGTDLQTVPMPWTYQERNGMDGLQRSDPFADDTCGDPTQADELVW